ncbi:TMEM165/GDT1 family protein [Prochlorococcus sp. MIT 1011]|uniref:TMEM165/GDT1 family protein n=1 Tax=Prochlorococcus sp. MIT 1011 TaxID=3082520 RepID=UPI0039B3A144
MGQPNSNSQIEMNESKDGTNFFSILITTFSTIFLAELGDKTQLATLLLSAQSGRPLIIFIGAALALISTSLLGVLIGRWIANNLPRQRFTVLSGIIMLSLGLYLVSQGFVDFIQN